MALDVDDPMMKTVHAGKFLDTVPHTSFPECTTTHLELSLWCRGACRAGVGGALAAGRVDSMCSGG